MSSGKGSRRDPDDDPEVDEEEDEDDEAKTKPRPSATHRKRPKAKDAKPVQRWESGGPEPEEDDEEDLPSPRGRKPVYWRARDSLYFEPLVALAIVVVLIVALFAFTQNWPPIYVVESDSMQHGSTDQIGLINTGDLVLAQKVSNSSITPYVVGLRTGYSTYGEYGDVLLYHPNGVATTPIIHRSILFLSWDPATSSYSADDLLGLPCGTAPNAVYATPGTSDSCGTTGLTGTLDLYHIGWMSVNVSINLGAPALGEHSGFLTMGDNNLFCSTPSHCIGEPDQGGTTTPVISSLVEPGWVVGVARGMVPWFGALKLLISGDAGMVPPQSWQYLGLTVVGIILLAFGIHYAFRAEGIETPLRKREEEERAAARGEDEGNGDEEQRSGWLHKLRPWHRSADEDDEYEALKKESGSSRTKKGPAPSHRRRGRPRPNVTKPKKSDRSDGDEEL